MKNILAIITLVAISSCKKDKCSEESAINFDSKASCKYSKVAFHSTYILSPPIKVYVDDNIIAEINERWGETVPYGTQSDILHYQLKDGSVHSWKSTDSLHTHNGTVQSNGNELVWINLSQ